MTAQIQQILRKDWKVLWPIVAIVAALSLVIDWLHYRLGFFADYAATWNGVEFLEQISMIGWVVAVAAVVHQDRILGSTQDWLVRPIRRLDLVLAKLLFVVVLLHGPLFVAHVVALTAQGFPFTRSLAAAASSAGGKLLFYTLPVFALAAVTRNMVELVIAGLAGALLLVGLLGSLGLLGLYGGSVGLSNECGSTTCGTDVVWLADSVRLVFLTGVVAGVLWLQYFRRGVTAWSRAVIVAGLVGVVALGLLPWSFFFGLQQAWSGDEGRADAVSVSFEQREDRSAEAGPTGRLGTDFAATAIVAARNTLSGGRYEDPSASREQPRVPGPRVSISIAIAGLPEETVLWADRIEARLIDERGSVVFRGRSRELEVRGDESARQVARHALAVPAEVYEALAGRELRLEVDYWLTLLELAAALTLPASGGEGVLDETTLCAARPADGGSAVQLRCLAIGARPSCFSARLEGLSGSQSRDLLVCRPSYAPYVGGSPAVRRFGIDIAGGLSRPEAAPEVPSLVRVETYRPSGHFMRQIVEPRFRLGD